MAAGGAAVAAPLGRGARRLQRRSAVPFFYILVVVLLLAEVHSDLAVVPLAAWRPVCPLRARRWGRRQAAWQFWLRRWVAQAAVPVGAVVAAAPPMVGMLALVADVGGSGGPAQDVRVLPILYDTL